MAIFLLSPSATAAVDKYWNVASGNWSDTVPCPWNPSPEPTSSDNAYITNGGTAIVNQSGEACNYLYLGAYNSGKVQITGGSINAIQEYVGYWGTGNLTHSAGTNTLSTVYANLYLGYNTGVSGTYELSGTGQLSTPGESIGYSGTGTFNQSAGTNTVGDIYLGYNSSGNGTYNLSGTGQLIVTYTEMIGFSGTGIFTHSTGTNTVSAWLYLGYNAGANGSYNMSSAGELKAPNEYIGQGGTGTFTQSAGTNTVGDIYLGYYSSGTGTYDLSGTGQLSVTNNKNEYIGYSGTGTFTQSGGTNTVSYILSLGYNSGANGTYDLSGTGTLNCGSELIGYSGTGKFTHLAGTNTISNSLCLGDKSGSSGTYELSSSGQLSAGYEYVGYSGTGTFTQSAGTNTVSLSNTGLYLGYYSDANGTYNLSGTGHLNASLEYIGNSGVGIFNHTAGTNTVSGGWPNAIYLGYNPSGNGTYNLSGAGQLTAEREYVGNLSTGTLSQSAGTNTVTNYLYLGYNSGSNGTYDLSGTGQLEVSFMEYVGYSGTGIFKHSAGVNSNSISGYLTLGYNSGANGTYNLSGTGHLYANYEYIGDSGVGTFNQSGGTNSVSKALYLGFGSDSSGTYNLTGGTLELKSINKGSGTATFNFGGGTLKASDNFSTTLPMTLTGTGGNANINTSVYIVTLSGLISGSGGLNKLGAGTLEFDGGINTSGTTLINVKSGKAILETVNINETDLNITTAASATLEVFNGAHTVGIISGNGTTLVDSGASLTATSISQNTLTIGSGATVTIQAIPGGPMSGIITPIPEPAAIVLLAGAFVMLALAKTIGHVQGTGD
ncbi:MAG: hypothetical protein ABSA26_08385 [Thermoguttaceae bacterium]